MAFILPNDFNKDEFLNRFETPVIQAYWKMYLEDLDHPIWNHLPIVEVFNMHMWNIRTERINSRNQKAP